MFNLTIFKDGYENSYSGEAEECPAPRIRLIRDNITYYLPLEEITGINVKEFTVYFSGKKYKIKNTWASSRWDWDKYHTSWEEVVSNGLRI